MVKFTLNMPQDVYDMLREKSFKEHVSMSSLIISSLIPQGAISTNGEKVKKIAARFPNTVDVLPREGLVKQRGELNSDDYVSWRFYKREMAQVQEGS